MKKRNSLIELYRFIFAINVVKNHGFLPYQGPYFGPGRISVEFFFVLTGFLLLKSINKFTNMPYKEGIFKFIVAKLKSLWIPLVIAIPFNIFYKILVQDYSLNVWGYLWYVNAMIVTFIFYFTCKYFIKNEKTFIILTSIIFVIASILHVTPFFYWFKGVVRAAMGRSLGMLISYIPKLQIKKKFLIWLILIPIQIAILAILIFGNNLLIEEILDLILYPALIYFTFQLDIDNKVFNYLGALSFGLYAFQCVTRPLEELGLTNIWILFIIIVALSVIEDLIKRIYRKYKAQRLGFLN